MTNLANTDTWVTDIYEIQIDDIVIGGAAGKANKQPLQLANRTNWLKRQMDEVIQAAGMTPNAATLDQLAQAIQQLGGGGIALGTPFWHLGETPPPGAMEFGGQLLSRTLYADLWAHISKVENNIELVSDAQWVAGQTGCWSGGDGATTFRAPKLLGDFLRVFDSSNLIDIGRVFGSHQGDAIRNITGDWNASGSEGISGDHSSTFDGALHSDGSIGNRSYGGTTNNTHLLHLGFDASRVVPTADENRPRNTAWLLCFRYE